MVRNASLFVILVAVCMSSIQIASAVDICCAIKPDSNTTSTCSPCSPSVINPDAKGVIPLVIFTTNSLVDTGCVDFDATQIDPTTLRFGPSNAEAVHVDLTDIDKDNDYDMVVKFKMQETGIKKGDTSVELSGNTIGGVDFHYTGAISTVPKKKSSVYFTPHINPGDPLLFTLRNEMGYFIEYYGEKDAEGFATKVNLIRVTAGSGDVTVIVLDGSNRPVRIFADNGTVFEIVWQSSTQILLTAVSPNGSIQVNLSIDLATSTTTQESLISSELTESLDIVSSTDARNGVPTQLKVTELPLEASSVSMNSTSQSLINVTHCGSAVDNALAEMLVVPEDSSPFTLSAQFVGNGVYSVSIPTQSSEIGEQAQEICESIAGPLGDVCTALSLIPPSADVLICSSIGAAIDTILFPPSGEGVLIMAACESSFTAARAYCATGGASPGPGAPSLADFICDNIDDIIDNFAVGEVYLKPTAIIPGVGSASAPGVFVQATGPYPSFEVEAGGEIQIVSLTTNPIDPLPYQSYVATAQIRCVPPQTLVTMSIIGTDGYQDSQSTIVEGNVSTTLWVPGAYEGVVDTVTVQVGGQSKQTVLVF